MCFEANQLQENRVPVYASAQLSADPACVRSPHRMFVCMPLGGILAACRVYRSAMVASWVSQASFEPLGLTIAVAKDRAIESMMQVRVSYTVVFSFQLTACLVCQSLV